MRDPSQGERRHARGPTPRRLLAPLLPLLLLAAPLAGDPAAAPPAAPAPATPVELATPESLLADAFANRYDVDTIFDLELVTDGPRGHSQRRLHTLTKQVEGRSRSIGRLREPATLRGTTVMIIETDDGGRDTFIYLPALKRARRISGAQRSDSFLGTELNFEDFERQRAGDFVLERLPDEVVSGEPCAIVAGTPRKSAAYRRVHFAIARDGAILEYRYFKANRKDPYRVIQTPREDMVLREGHLLPTRFTVHNRVRDITTVAVIHEMDVGSEIDARIFSIRTLEQERPLPGIGE